MNSKTEPVDSIQKKKDIDKEPQSPSYQQLTKVEKLNNENQNINVPVSQHVPAQQLLSPSHNPSPQPKDESKDKTLLKVANSTTITLIENGTNGDKDNYPKNYFTLESKLDKKDDHKNSITITKTVPKQSPNGQTDKSKPPAKSANKRPLQYLETLAEKAGITFEDKYEAANTLLALDKQNTVNRRPPELKQPKTEPENSQEDYNRYRNQKDEDDKLQIQQQIIQQQQQQQLQQIQLHQQQLQHFQQQALQRQQQQVLQHIKNQHDQQELLQKQFQQQQKPELLTVTQSADGQQKFLQPLHTQQFNVPGIGEINLSFLASPQNNVNLVFDKSQKTGMNADIKPQQVDGQSQVVQQMNMSQHDNSQQHHQTVTVVSSMPNSMAHQVQQTTGGIQQQAGQLSNMPPLHNLPQNTQQAQQLSTDWGHGRVQVIQQPMANNAYLQQLYNNSGPLIMPGNIALHPGINSQQIQVIAAGKPFQGNQLAPHMLTQGKQVLQGQAAPFPGYTTIPAIPTTQNQTFVFSPLSVINSQPSILPAHSQPTVSGIGQQKQTDMHKCGTKGSGKVGTSAGQTVQTQCVQVSQPVLGSQQPTQTQIISPLQAGGQPMQFAPWQISGALPQVWTGGLSAGTIPAGGLLAPNPTLFIRGNQPDQPHSTSMFIQHSPQNVPQNTSIACATPTVTAKPRASTDGMSKGPRPLSNILPSAGIRPAASVSTQTTQAQSTPVSTTLKQTLTGTTTSTTITVSNEREIIDLMSNILRERIRAIVYDNDKVTPTCPSEEKAPRQREFNGVKLPRGNKGVRSPAPASKQDAANQTNKMQHQLQQPKQQLLVMNANGQMTQITSVQDKQALTKNMQQQALMQQQIQQQQQQQLMHQQTQQMVQHYQQQGLQGMQMMQQSALPVGSVAQSMSGMPQTISMVQQIHPLSGMSQQGTLVGQLNPPQQGQISQVQAMQQQPQTLVGTGMVQTSVGMAVQPQTLTHPAPMQTPSITIEGASVMSPLLQVPTIPYNMTHAELTLQGGGVGLIATPVQGSVMPMQPTLVTHITKDDDKMPPPPAPIVQQIVPQVATAEAETATPVFSTVTTTASTTVTATVSASVASVSSATDASTSTTSHSVQTEVKTSPLKASVADSVPAPSTTTVSSGAQAVSSATSTSPGRPPTAPAPLSVYKPAQSSTRTQTINSEVKTVSQQPPSDLGSKGTLDNLYYKGLPKAMVKPNILTHVIEGYVIQEAAEPFAVNRPLREWGTSSAASTISSASTSTATSATQSDRSERETREPREITRDSRDIARENREILRGEMMRDSREVREIREARDREAREARESREPREMTQREVRDMRDRERYDRERDRERERESRRERERERERENREAREVTVSPPKVRDNRKEQRADEPPRKKKMVHSNRSHISSSSRDHAEAGSSKSCRDQPTEGIEPKIEDTEATKWSVSEVCDFIRNIPGCANYADEFLMQEVDGEALLLIKPEHLVMALSMKLGPALKIVACIDALRPVNEQKQNREDPE